VGAQGRAGARTVEAESMRRRGGSACTIVRVRVAVIVRVAVARARRRSNERANRKWRANRKLWVGMAWAAKPCTALRLG